MSETTPFLRLGGRQASLPPDLRIYAVGDVHGRLDLLHEIERQIDADAASVPGRRTVQVMLGDYIDRGPDSAGVIAHLMARGRERELVTLRGNHEAYVMEIAAKPERFEQWCRFGGRQTLASYGLDLSGFDDAALDTRSADLVPRALAAVPGEHHDFLARTGLTWRCGDYIFVHAGLRPGVPFDRQSTDDLVWIRHEFLDSDEDFGCVVVHGHTPGDEPVIRANRIGIDTRAYASGVLTCLVLDGVDRRFLSTGAMA